MKKICAIFLAMLMVLSSVSALAAVESFDTNGSTWTVGLGASIITKPDASENCVLIRGKNTGGVSKVINASGILTVEADVFYNNSYSNLKVPEISAKNANGKEVVIGSLSIIGGGISLLHGDGQKNTRTTELISSNTWHKITVEINTEKDAISSWLDGKPVAMNKSFIDGFNADVITKVAFCSNGLGSSGYIDNINYYSGKAKDVEQSSELSKDEIFVKEDFNSKAIDMIVDPAVKQASIDESDPTNLSMQIPSPINKKLSKSLGEYKGTVTVEADILVKESATQIKIPDINLNGGGTQGVLCSVIGNKVSVPYFKSGANVRATKDITLGEWFRITVQASTETDLFTVWVNGEVVIKDVPYYNGVNADSLSIVTFTSNHANNPNFYVDNVFIYKGEAKLGTASTTEKVTSTDFLARTVMMKKDSNVAYKTNYRTEMSVTSFEQDGKVYFPIDEVAKGFSNESVLDTITNTQHLAYYGDVVKVPANSTTFTFNKEERSLTDPTIIKDGIMYATVDTLGKIFDRDVHYDSSTGIALITTKGYMAESAMLTKFIPELLALYNEKLLPDVELYVSPDGKEGNDGSFEKPFPSIPAAQKAVRALIKGGKVGNINVNVRKGTYYLSDSIKFTSADSRTGNYRTTYKKYEGDDELPLIDGGVRITNWKPYKNGIYVSDLPAGVNPETLYENGNRVTIARYPNTGYNRVIGFEQPAKDGFFIRDGEVPQVSNFLELQVFCWPGGGAGYINWSTARAGIKAFDEKTRQVTLAKPVTYVMGTGSRYYLYNSLDLLDAPGEFYVDKEKSQIYYMPVSKNIDDAVIVTPAEFDMITATGAANNKISNITFDGLQIRSTDLNKNNVFLTNVQNIEIKNCQIYNSGNIGIYIKGQSRNCKLDGNLIYQTGFYGVFIEGEKNITLQRECYGHTLTNSYIHHIGEMNGNASGVRFAHTQYTYGAYNRVTDSPRNALHILGAPNQNIIGNTYEGVTATDANAESLKPSVYNTFEYNDTSKVIQDSQDTNAIGAWGIGERNVIRKNTIYNCTLPLITLTAGHSFWFPIYFDENSNLSYITGNIIFDNQQTEGGLLRSDIMNNASRNNTVTNNILADEHLTKGSVTVNDMDGDVRRSRGLIYERNLMSSFPDVSYVFQGWVPNFTVKSVDNNLFYNTNGKYLMTSSVSSTLEEWKNVDGGKYDQNSIMAPPQYVDEKGRDYRLSYESPAYLIGFEDINQSDIGLQRDYPFAIKNDSLKQMFVYRQGDYYKKAWATLNVGDKAQLAMDIRTENGYLVYNDTISATYASSNDSVAKVDSNGLVNVLGKGRSTITVTASRDGKQVASKFDVIVGDENISSLSIIGIPESMEVNQVTSAKVTAISELGKQMMVNDFTLSADSDIVSIDGSQITAMKSGTVKITAVSKSHPEVKAETTLSCVAAKFAKIVTNVDKKEYQVGDTINVSKKLFDTQSMQLDESGAAYEYIGDVDNIVVVENGQLVAKKSGMAKVQVRATYKDGVTLTSTIGVAVVPQNVVKPAGYTFYNFNNANYAVTSGYCYVEEDGRIRLVTSGNDAWSSQDAISAILKPIQSSKKTTVSTVVNTLTTPVEYGANGNVAIHAAAGVMIRDKETDNSKNVFVRYRLNGDIIMTYRTEEGGSTVYLKSTTKPKQPVEVKLERDGKKFTGYYKDQDGGWSLIGTVEIDMTDEDYSGVALQSGVQGDFNYAIFSDLNVNQE